MFDKYLSRNNKTKGLIKEKPEKDLFNIIVIPCYNESEIIRVLDSLKKCNKTKTSSEVIIVVNSSEKSTKEIIEFNKTTFSKIKEFAKKNNSIKLKFFPVIVENIPGKKAGAGYARKIGMDEAVFRFNSIKTNGIITSLDADTFVEKNYLQVLENQFYKTRTNAGSIFFKHDIDQSKYNNEVIKAIKIYELYLRYFKQSLKFANYPFATHTVGSAFAVKTDVYIKYGGIKPSAAGEDFYFIQKIIQAGNYAEITETKVFPSSRLSNRVVFGTGPAINEIIDNNFNYLVYNFENFKILKDFFNDIEKFHKISKSETEEIISNYHKSLYSFLTDTGFVEKISKINSNTNSLTTFLKGFYNFFNTFMVIKYLNYSSNNYFLKKDIISQADKLIKEIKNNNKLLNLDVLLETFENMDLL